MFVGQRAERTAMTEYYRSDVALITHEVLEIWIPQYQRFAIRDLHDVRVVRAGPDPLVIISAVLTGTLAVGVAVCSPFLHTPAAWSAAIAVVAIPGVLGGACWRLYPPQWELVATYRTLRVRIFATRDSRTFGQIRRALLRAMEANERV
jgi:hypothetical protein